MLAMIGRVSIITFWFNNNFVIGNFNFNLSSIELICLEGSILEDINSINGKRIDIDFFSISNSDFNLISSNIFNFDNPFIRLTRDGGIICGT